MFSKNKARTANIDTVIGRNTTLEGDVHFAGGLHVEGVIQGDLIANNKEKSILILTQKGRIEGDIRGTVVVLDGEVLGNVTASVSLELAHHARVKGNVSYKTLEMEGGAVVNGVLSQLQSTDQTTTVDLQPNLEKEV
ncbi:MAG: polymer-forming cytoskeletal protein [Gammaproteobacteria bacterium]|jgi:cytoskeletal protein CcmA (bactofilin family)|nr:polymer-forming cytoskeletal protein [Gammaproteobacteria bacterium]